MPSTPQTVATVVLFDYLTSNGTAVPNARISVMLNSTKPATAISPVVTLMQTQWFTTTDPNGYWQFSLPSNLNISPSNTTYTVSTPDASYDVTLGSGGPYQSTAFGTIVNVITPLAAATSSITGPLTVAGLLTAQAGENITGNLAVTGNLSVSGTFTPASITVTAGEPGIDTAAAGALLLGDNNATSIELGSATTISAGGLTVATTGLTVSAGGAAITGATTVTGTLLSTAALTVQSGGAAIVGTSSVTGTLNVTGALSTGTSMTVTAGDLTVTAGRLAFSAAAAKIIPGVTSLSHRNNADNADNLLITDLGLLTIRNALEVPPSAGGTLAPHAYGTLEVKLDEQTTASGASLTLTVPAGALYRALRIEFTARSDQASAQALNVQFNADVGANYDSQFVTDVNVTLTAQAPTVAATAGTIGTLCPSGATAGAEAHADIRIQNADSTTLRKQWRFLGGRFDADSAAGSVLFWGHGQWRNTANAITSIKLAGAVGNLVSARAILYGIA